MRRDPRSGQEFFKIYRNQHGVNMLGKSARYQNDIGGAQAQWPIIEEVRLYIEAGRFKVFRTCVEFFEEYRSYHTKDGNIVAKRDDVLKAVFYAMMMRRYARSEMASGRVNKGVGSFTTAIH